MKLLNLEYLYAKVKMTDPSLPFKTIGIFIHYSICACVIPQLSSWEELDPAAGDVPSEKSAAETCHRRLGPLLCFQTKERRGDIRNLKRLIVFKL